MGRHRSARAHHPGRKPRLPAVTNGDVEPWRCDQVGVNHGCAPSALERDSIRSRPQRGSDSACAGRPSPEANCLAFLLRSRSAKDQLVERPRVDTGSRRLGAQNTSGLANSARRRRRRAAPSPVSMTRGCRAIWYGYRRGARPGRMPICPDCPTEPPFAAERARRASVRSMCDSTRRRQRGRGTDPGSADSSWRRPCAVPWPSWIIVLTFPSSPASRFWSSDR